MSFKCRWHSDGWRAVLDLHRRDVLARDGFVGFSTVKSLRLTRCAESAGPTRCLRRSQAWFCRASVLGARIRGPVQGKGSKRSRFCSPTRLGCHGDGTICWKSRRRKDQGAFKTKDRPADSVRIRSRNVAHWGGRYLWQLADAEDLVLCWKPTPRSDPRSVEKAMISDFEVTYGRRPYANRIR